MLSSIDVIVEVTVTDGTAIGKHIICTQQCLLVCIYTGGMDYDETASVFNVTISAGATSSSFNIDIIDDVTHEDNETFNVAIRLLPSCLLLSINISSSTVMIIDDDGKHIHTCNTFTPQIKEKCQCIYLILHWLWNVNEICALILVRISP